MHTGASGFVSIDNEAGRDPTFVIKTLDKNKQLVLVAYIKLSKQEGSV